MLIISSHWTPAGWLELAYDEHYLYRAVFTHASTDIETTQQPVGPLGHLITEQLAAYSANPEHHFQLPLKPLGTLYQQNVWKALLVIPARRTLTYGELAAKLQTSPRAIGQACKKNPIALFIPCHRVVAQSSMGGYMGRMDALHFKLALLNHERSWL